MGGRSVQGRAKPALIVMMVAGATMFLASFMPFYVAGDEFDSVSVNVWGRAVSAGQLRRSLRRGVGDPERVVRAFGNVKAPERILTLDVKQQGFVLAFACVTIMLGYLVADTPDKGVGFWLSIMATFALDCRVDHGSCGLWKCSGRRIRTPHGFSRDGVWHPGNRCSGSSAVRRTASERTASFPGGQPPGFGRRLN